MVRRGGETNLRINIGCRFLTTMTPSEQYVAELCSRSFLPFWSHVSPRRWDGKELCDALVVCGPSVILISVKEVASSADSEVAYERWIREAVENSVKQLYGAERVLGLAGRRFYDQMGQDIVLPAPSERQVFRLAIAFGSKEDYPIASKDFGKGFVHVMDEESVKIVFNELNTVTDFVQYLSDKEILLSNKWLVYNSEADLLAYYFTDGFDGPMKDANYVYIDEGLWEKYSNSADYMEFNRDIEASYFWDAMIQSFHWSIESGTIDLSRRGELESALRWVNRASRLERKDLSHIFEDIGKIKSRARIVRQEGSGDHIYVLMRVNETNRSCADKELFLRCLVARVMYPEVREVIGVCAVSSPTSELTWDFVHIDTSVVSKKMRRAAAEIQSEFGYFINAREAPFHRGSSRERA